MEVKAQAKFIRMSPTKVRLVARLVKKLPAEQALDQLRFADKRAAGPVAKLIESALANAAHNYELARDNLYIKEIRVDQGSILKRWLPRAHGRATPLKKKSSHIRLTLKEIKASGKKAAKKQALDAPIRLGEQPKKKDEVKLREPAEKKPVELKRDELKEKGKIIDDPRLEGRRGQAKIEGGVKGFAARVFHRKSG